MCSQSTNCSYVVGGERQDWGLAEKRFIDKHLDEVSEVWIQNGICKIKA